ncbi:restriction endonuclease [Ornithinimicrobium avium]|uniref:Restriction endonuclease type IV Mrr domain-containing protein n=1 Tax=Ornithinimicrobium avium TaxID=2283195 RepID=A0A345NKE9_9MICO|nr:restriction endonuclease [Ornithinimicrobium avium]AXH95507.1 hypothetical protein DV701_04605 [Ornithinimicrobium avium]
MSTCTPGLRFRGVTSHATSASGDAGADGVTGQDPLRTDCILVQAKRYAATLWRLLPYRCRAGSEPLASPP